MSYLTICAETENGRRVDVLVERDDAPRLGEKFEDEGRALTRVPTTFGVQVSRHDCVCYQLPREATVRKNGLTPAPRYNSKGYAVFDSKKEVNEYLTAHNDNPKNGSKGTWNCDGNE